MSEENKKDTPEIAEKIAACFAAANIARNYKEDRAKFVEEYWLQQAKLLLNTHDLKN